MTRLSLVPILGIAALALATPAHAQFGSVWRNGRAAQPSYNGDRAAYDNGFRQGQREGEKDGRQREAFRFDDERSYQRADEGYRSEFGDVNRYRDEFRRGYGAGYSDGYRRYAPNYRAPGYGAGTAYGTGSGYGYGAGYGYNDPAYDVGFNDGYGKGLEDVQKNRSYDVTRHKWYREGDHDYKSQYGSRQRYEDVYRDAFKAGYDRAMREGRYR
jgi:hypothetical protein